MSYTPGGLNTKISSNIYTNGIGAITAVSLASVLAYVASLFLAYTPTAVSNTALSAIASTAYPQVTRLGYAAAGDSPPVVYTPSGAACSLNAGAGDGASQVPSADGKCWIGNFNGRLSVASFGQHNNFSADDGAALAAAISAASAAGSGTVILDSKPYWNNSQNILVPATVRLACAGGFVKSTAQWGVNYTSYPCSIYQASGKTFTVQGNADGIGVFSDWVHFGPQPTNSSSRAAITSFIAGYAGTGVSVTGANARLSNIVIGGFNLCLRASNVSQIQIYDILGDCTNGMDASLSFDVSNLTNVEFWPFLTTNLTHSFDAWNISALADNGSGLWRVTTTATNNLATGEQVWVASNGTSGAGAGGLWTITVIDTTHFDLQGSATAPTTTGNPTNTLTYIPVASVANLQPGMNVSGTGIPAGAKIAAVWRSRNAISLDQSHPVTATNTGITLSFTSDAYSGSAGGAMVDETYRSGTGFRMGQDDGWTCSACFAFGNLIGYNFNGAQSNNFANSSYEILTASGSIAVPHLANQYAVPIGVEFTDNSGISLSASKNLFAGTDFAEASVVFLSTTTAAGAGSANKIIGVQPGGNSGTISTLAEIGGTATLDLIGLSDVLGGNHSILIDNSVIQPPLFVADYFPAAAIYGTIANPNWLTQSSFGGIAGLNLAPNLLAQQITAQGQVYANVNVEAMAAAANAKIWRWIAEADGTLHYQTLTDDYLTANDVIVMARSGASPTAVTIGAPTTIAAGTVAAAGNAAWFKSYDGAAEGGQIELTNTNGSLNKFFRVTNAGDLQILPSGYGANIFDLTDGGTLTLVGAVKAPALVATGSAPTASGTCAIYAQVGGNTAGSFKFNGACSAAGTVILTFATTAPTGWACSATDMTTPADPLPETAYSTTAATFKATAGASSADQAVFACTAF